MPKTTISGTPREFDQEELNARIERAITVYKMTDNKEMVFATFPRDLLLEVNNRLNAGWSLHERCYTMLGALDNRVEMTKPESVQQADIEAIKAKAKADYIAELHIERDHYKALLVQQLAEAEAEKEERKLEAARVKKMVEFEKLAEQTFGDLVIPK